jgi:hypothetical protein
MKKLLLIALILLVFKTTFAQYRGQFDDKKFFISLGGEIGAPSNTPYNVTYGASAAAEVKVADHIGLTLTGEYAAFNYKSGILYSDNPSYHPYLLPIKAGIKYYTNPGFYFGGELGSTVQTNTVYGTMFVYSVGFGLEIPVNRISNVDVSFRYEGYGQAQYQTTGMRLAYRLGW